MPLLEREITNMRNVFAKKSASCDTIAHKLSAVPLLESIVEWSACDYDQLKRTRGLKPMLFACDQSDRVYDSQQFAI